MEKCSVCGSELEMLLTSTYCPKGCIKGTPSKTPDVDRNIFKTQYQQRPYGIELKDSDWEYIGECYSIIHAKSVNIDGLPLGMINNSDTSEWTICYSTKERINNWMSCPPDPPGLSEAFMKGKHSLMINRITNEFKLINNIRGRRTKSKLDNEHDIWKRFL